MKTPCRAMSVRTVIVISLVVAVLAVVIVGVILLDSPAEVRARRLDERRVDDLRDIARRLDFYWTREGTLPSSLEDLANEPGVFIELYDPETGQPYEYRVLGSNAYELCAEFARDTAEGQGRPYRDYWPHGQGRHCFELKAQAVERPLER
ncbi:hypothetical protein KAW44_05270 [Candidatus Bipolaricaulota bacterium]|nr:hypothetical protein [Candidatus Bipolaricaulota bacterium]